MGGGKGGQKVSKGLTSTRKTKRCLLAPQQEFSDEKVARNQRKNAKKTKSASCSFQNLSVSLSKMNSVYPTDETALSIRKTQRSNFTYDFRCFFFFFFYKIWGKNMPLTAHFSKNHKTKFEEKEHSGIMGKPLHPASTGGIKLHDASP